MTRHLLKLVWHRKRASALVVAELFFSFLVVTVLLTAGIYTWSNYRRPLGFDWTDVWRVSIDLGTSFDQLGPEVYETLDQVVREAGALDRVTAAAGISNAPYDGSTDTSGLPMPDGTFETAETVGATDGLLEALDVEIVAGRWFDARDDAADFQPVVIDRELARLVFGDEDPLGRYLDPADRTDPGESIGRPRRRVVGVVDDFRKAGELSGAGPFFIGRQRPTDMAYRPYRNLVLEMAPGTPAAYEEVVLERLGAVAPDWTFGVQPLAAMRETSFRLRLAPLVVGGVIALFLLAMVALGLVGVLWQNVVQRTRELGLRRAAGATRGDVRRQISMELLLLTSLALGLGTLLLVQLPVLDLLPALGAGVFAAGLLLAVALMYALVLAAAAYPAWLASRVQPAEALRWE